MRTRKPWTLSLYSEKGSREKSWQIIHEKYPADSSSVHLAVWAIIWWFSAEIYICKIEWSVHGFLVHTVKQLFHFFARTYSVLSREKKALKVRHVQYNTTFSPSHPDSPITDWSTNTALLTIAFANAMFLAVLSKMAVVGNALILAAIWKKTFARTPFHILVSGLAFTDLCTGLIAQPFYVATTFMYVAIPKVQNDRSLLYITLDTIGEGGAIYFISVTILLITLMSIERWLHMSRRSLLLIFAGT